MKKRVFALLLCLVLCLSILPVGAFADEYCEHEIVKMEAKATCGEAHREHYKCTKCGKLFSDERGEHEISYADVALEKPVHTSGLAHVAPVAPTCTTGGNEEYWVCTDADCGQMFYDNPGTTEEGKDLSRINPIPDDQVRSVFLPPLGHNLTFHDAVPHTCTQNGTVAYYQCENCWQCFSDPDAQNLLEDITDYAPGHVKTEYPAVARTCDTNGNSYYFYCEVCGKYYDENEQVIEEGSWVIPAGHDYQEHPLQEPTCTAGGNRLYYTCSGCDKVFDANLNETTMEAVTLNMIPHSLDIHVPAAAKTCWDNGNIEYWQCTSCGAKFADAGGTLPLTDDEVVIPACHEFEATSAKEATCTEPGNIAYWTCTVEGCGYTIDEGGNQVWETAIPAKGHAFQLHEALEASCTEDGNEAYYSCDTCGKLFRLDGVTETTLEEVTIPQFGHKLGDLVQAVEPTCTTDGHIAYYECEQCHEKFADAEGETALTEDEIVIPKSHELEAHPAKAATCTEPGNIAYSTCKNCDIVLNENGDQIWLNDVVIQAAGHSLQMHDARTATCTEGGNEAYYSCDTCGKLFRLDGVTETTLEEVTIPQLGHKLGDPVQSVEQTCTADGHIAYYECEQCHEKFADAEGEKVLTEDEIVIPKSHELEAHAAKAATCTEPGNIAYSTCKNCGIVLNENGDQILLNDTVIPAPGHKPEKVEATASCTEAGYAEHYKCSTCGKPFKDVACTAETTLEELTVQALGHDYDADGWCTRCKAVSPEAPAFIPQPVTVPNNDNTYVVVTVSAPEGVFPANCQLSVQPVFVVDDQTREAVDAQRQEGATVAKSFTYDIKVFKNGEEIQPADGSKVKVSFALAAAKNENLDAAVYHVTEAEDGSKAAKALETSVENEAVVTETDGFSYYTVELTYRELQYVLPGGSNVALTTILNTLGLQGSIENAVSSNTALFEAKNEGGVWTVYSYGPFQTVETLTVRLDGVDYVIKVTDAAAKVKVTNGKAYAGSQTKEQAQTEITVGSGKVNVFTTLPTEQFYRWTYTVPAGKTISVDVAKAETSFTMPGAVADTDVYAFTAEKKCAVTFEMNGHGIVSPNPQYVNPNGFATKPIPTAEGFVFDNWYTDNDTFKNVFDFSKTQITGDITLYAKWRCRVTFNTLHGTAPTAQIVDIGKTVDKPTDLSWIGYTWGGWYTDPAWTNAFDFKTPINRDTVLFARWIPDLKITKGDGGTAHYGSTYAFTLNYYYPDYNKNSKIFEVFIARSGSKDLALLGKEHYVVTQGADKRAVVTLKASYIRTLADGLTYDIVFDTGLGPYEYDAREYPPIDLGATGGSFRVSKAPKTGDESNIALWAAIAGISLIAVVVIAAVLLNKRKKSKKAPTLPENRPADKTEKPPKE